MTATEEPCLTCEHSWHGEPCWLRLEKASYPMYPSCPCRGAFGVLAEKEPYPYA